MDQQRSSATPRAHAAARDLAVANDMGEQHGLSASAEDEQDRRDAEPDDAPSEPEGHDAG
jgi:hypothetical protein